MKKIKTFLEACEKLGIDPKAALPYPDPKNRDEISINAYSKLVIIVRVLNEGWIPDWNNSDQYKYWPYFDMRSKPGFGFSNASYVYWCTDSAVGSRLCFKSRELAEYAANTFLNIYDEYINL